YNHPFEDDLLISIETLTYDTPDGPKKWGAVSNKKLKEWKKEVLKPLMWAKVGTAYVLVLLTATAWQEVDDQESPENSHMDTSDIDGESDANIVSLRRKFEDINFQSLYGDDRKNQGKVKVQMDVIVQDYAREIPKWITIAPQGSSECLHLASPVREPNDQAAVCRKKVELSNECSSSRPLQLQFSGVPISPNTVTIPRHRPFPELNKTCYDYILEEYQSADEECSWSNVTLGDLYPAMVEIFKKLMTKKSRIKALKHMFGHLKHRKGHSRRPKLNVTVDKIRGFRPFKLKKALPSICSSISEDIQNQTFGNENRELHDDMCSIIKLSGPVPCSCMDTNKIKRGYSDSSLEHHLLSGKDPKVSKQTVFPNVMIRMGETFLVEDGLQTTVSLKNSEHKASEKVACKCSLEHNFIGSTASAGSTALDLAKESKTQKTDFLCDDTSELCSSTCSSHGNRNTFTPVTSCSLVKAPNTLLVSPEKISECLISFQHKHSFSSSPMKQSPSKIPQKYEDAFEKLYYKLCCKETQKPLTLARPLSNSQNLEEKGGLMNHNLSDSLRSSTQYDRKFDRIMSNCVVTLFQNFLGFRELQI
ncbi:PREDICTED: LOW QUALITY PROTEIN: Holliday junction recognition protein, partial [Chlamydotis macqueenii]|uniref:LOW QUALITY PROTEIN: Holliday junction recognition protein n=1 Tax=Chlamydotis macqueenii TaxID=187382 RepID=UPI000529BE7A